jgi:anthraniloyl-CoA monooxygenase
MRIACLGGGPAGLYFAISMKLRDPAHEVVVFERNRADDTFGWGVVLSEETLQNLAANDPVSAEAIRAHFAYWDDIAVVKEGERVVSTGHGFCGIGRKQLLLLLQDRARELGVELRFETELPGASAIMADYDLVVAADGLNSRTREEFADAFRPAVDLRKCKFVWLGTHQKFDDAFTFIFEKTPKGWVWAHAYQFDPDTATFIVECTEETWARYGFGDMTQEESVAACEAIFRDHLGGHSLMSNAQPPERVGLDQLSPRALRAVVSRERRADGRRGGDGAFLHRIGLEACAWRSRSRWPIPALGTRHGRGLRQVRGGAADRGAAAPIGGAQLSLEWFEEVERYLDLDPVQFNYSLLTRSQRISHENLRLRDPEWLARARSGGSSGRGCRRMRRCARRCSRPSGCATWS